MVQNFQDKEWIMVLQGHSLAHLLDIYPDARGPLPSAEQTKTMTNITVRRRVNYLGWYGQSFLNASADETAHWEAILRESKAAVESAFPVHIRTFFLF